MVETPSSLPLGGPFAVPPVAVARHPGAKLAPRQLKAWLGSLPLANPPKTANLLLQELQLVVRDPQPGSRFAALLALFEEPTYALLEIVHERLAGNTDNAMPLDQLEYQLVEILEELAGGYLRLVNEQLERGKAPGAETLFRAMRLLDQASNIRRLHYQRLTPEAWRTLLALYAHTEHLGVSGQAFGTPGAGDGPRSARACFMRALVISLCDPHHRRPGEILDWLHWLTPNTDSLRLTVLPEGAFAIPVDVGGGLPPLASARRARPGPDTRYLACDDFLRLAEQDGDVGASLHRALMDLVRGRKSPEQRQSPRQPRNHPYRLVYGLRNIHRRLSELTRGRGGDANGPLSVAALQVNQSRAGAAFRLRGPLNPPLTVGEPILAEADSGAAGGPVGFTACLRRLVSSEAHAIEIGVAKLPGRLIPVTVSGATTERGHIDPHALLQQNTETGRYTLLGARGLYREGDTLSAEGPAARFHLRMVGMRLLVPHIAQIDVEMAQR